MIHVLFFTNRRPPGRMDYQMGHHFPPCSYMPPELNHEAQSHHDLRPSTTRPDLCQRIDLPFRTDFSARYDLVWIISIYSIIVGLQ